MTEFFTRYRNYIILIAGVLFFGIVIIVVFFVFNDDTVVPNQNIPADPNELNYSFLQNDQISKTDQLLMLQAKIIGEEYGTYSGQDIRGLLDIKNQATTDFQSKVDAILSSVDNQKNIVTTVDPESIKLHREGESVVVTMTATQTDLVANTQKNIELSVQFVHSSDYWLVSNILIQS